MERHLQTCSVIFTTLPPTPLKQEVTTSTPPPVPVYSFTFDFTCEITIQLSHEYSTDLVNQHTCQGTAEFELDFPTNVSESCLQIEIGRELHDLPFPEPYRSHMINKVVNRMICGIDSSKRGDNNFLVTVEISLLWNRIHESETFPRMIPATDESINLLEKKKGTDCESCLICLEEFSEDCLAAKMPCSHVFHSECIERWLKNSHYCPLCRYEMPITRLSSSIGDSDM